MNDQTEERLAPATDGAPPATKPVPVRSVAMPTLKAMAGPLLGVALVSLGSGFLLARHVDQESPSGLATYSITTIPGPAVVVPAGGTTTSAGGAATTRSDTTSVPTTSVPGPAMTASAGGTGGATTSAGATVVPAAATTEPTSADTTATTTAADTTVAAAGTTAATTPPAATTAAPTTTLPAPTTTRAQPATTRPAPTTLPGGAYAAAVRSSNPLGYWSLDEPSGGLAADGSGHGRVGVYAGGFFTDQPGALARGVGRAVRFESGSVDLPDSAALRLNGAFTIELWARLNTFENAGPGLVSKGPSAGANGYLVYYDTSGRVILRRNGVEVASSPEALRTDRFTHLALTYDGNTVRWYVDGAPSGSRSVSFPPNDGTTLLSIGRGEQYGDHTIDEVAFYDRELPPSTLAAHVDVARR